MKIQTLIKALTLLSISTIIISCSNSPTINDEQLQTIEQDSTTKKLTEIITQFKMPSPVDVYIFLWEDETRFTQEALNPLENVNKYNNTVKKAVNLGIYASDVAYCSVYGKNQLTMNYFAVSKKLADDLGLTEGFDEAFIKRINDNINNADSLYEITNDSYSQAVSYLQASGQTHLLPFITFGGWIESVNTICLTIKKFEKSPTGIQLLTDQGILLENLIDYYNSINTNDDINTILTDLKNLQKIYNQIFDSETGEMTKKQYQQIKNKISEIRNKWIN
jgi:hypothetical protein